MNCHTKKVTFQRPGRDVGSNATGNSNGGEKGGCEYIAITRVPSEAHGVDRRALGDTRMLGAGGFVWPPQARQEYVRSPVRVRGGWGEAIQGCKIALRRDRRA